MTELTRVTIDFEASHLVFPTIIAIVLGILGAVIVVRDRRAIVATGSYWARIFGDMDRPRFLGAIGLTVGYFLLMVPVGRVWPNTGLGFLLCSIPFVFATGILFMHDRNLRQMVPLAVVSIVGPVFVWWLFTYPLFLTLP